VKEVTREIIACANVANLMLARMSYRTREFCNTNRARAPCRRLMRQLLTESIALSVAGGCADLIWAKWALAGIKHISVLNLPGVSQIRLDGAVFAFTCFASIATGVLFGLLPSLQVLRRPLAADLRESGATAPLGSPRHRIVFGLSTRAFLVVAQVSMSICSANWSGSSVEKFCSHAQRESRISDNWSPDR